MARRSKAILAALSFMACPSVTEVLAAGNPLAFYTGAGLGVATPQNTFEDPYSPGRTVSGHEFGWDALVGIRPIRWAGAEAQYLDFGRTHLGPSPLPWRHPWLDLFGKVGVSHLWASYSYSAYYPDVYVCNTTRQCSSVGHVAGTVHADETDLAYGGGIQVHFGALAVRAEYQALDSKFGTPALVSIGLTCTY